MTNIATPNSANIFFFSTFFIFFVNPSKYLSSLLLAFKSLTVSIHSCIPSVQSITASFFFLVNIFCTFPDVPTIISAIGNTHKAAKAILQSKKNKLIAIIQVEIIEP